MIFSEVLIPGRLVKRYKRFLADVELADGTTITAHVPNSGALASLTTPGLEVRLSRSPNPERKLPYTYEMAFVDDTWVGANTSHPNNLVEEALAEKLIPYAQNYSKHRREVKYGRNSRIDFLLEHPGQPPLYLEVKNVHMRRGEPVAEFPDCVTSRGAKHLEEMSDMVKAGHRALTVYVVQRADCTGFRLAHDIDPTYAAAFAAATLVGVESICLACHVSPTKIEIERTLPILV